MSKYIKLYDAIMAMDEWFSEPITPTKILSDLPTIEVSEDCISREWVKGICENMLDEEMLGHMLGYIDNAPSVVPTTEQSSTDGEVDLMKLRAEGEDCISRKELSEGILMILNYWHVNTRCFDEVKDFIKNAPSVVPTTEQSSMVGEWVNASDSYEVICSNCECEAFTADGEWFLSDYCPNCGAKMKG